MIRSVTLRRGALALAIAALAGLTPARGQDPAAFAPVTVEHALGTTTIEHRPERPGDVRASRAVNTVLRGLFPDIEPVPLAEGLAQATAWMETRMMEAAR